MVTAKAVAWQLQYNNLATRVGKKMLSKHINMGSIFEDLGATKLTVKTDLSFDLRFKR